MSCNAYLGEGGELSWCNVHDVHFEADTFIGQCPVAKARLAAFEEAIAVVEELEGQLTDRLEDVNVNDLLGQIVGVNKAYHRLLAKLDEGDR